MTGAPVTLFDGLPAFVEQEDLPAIAVWLTDAQYTGLMTDEDDWQATLHTAVFLRLRLLIQSLISGWKKNLPALEEVSGLERLIDT
ncbi:phage minor tail U family protein [Salmonella enterica]|uniref:phage minor tail U family protein n=1 Tax=Salmonella enterica TaxID=28901 RepID=UPI001F24FF32|nr:phage minor tail U family protein [Salmonella enterica]